MNLNRINKILLQKYYLTKKRKELNNISPHEYNRRKELKIKIKNIDRYLQYLLKDEKGLCKIPYTNCSMDTTSSIKNLNFIKILTEDIWK